MSPGSEHIRDVEHLRNATVSFTHTRPQTAGALTSSAVGSAYGYGETPPSSTVRSQQATLRTDSPEPLVEFAGVYILSIWESLYVCTYVCVCAHVCAL
jgi:hypothetical protein